MWDLFCRKKCPPRPPLISSGRPLFVSHAHMSHRLHVPCTLRVQFHSHYTTARLNCQFQRTAYGKLYFPVFWILFKFMFHYRFIYTCYMTLHHRSSMFYMPGYGQIYISTWRCSCIKVNIRLYQHGKR